MLRREAVVGRNQNGILPTGSARIQSREMCRPPQRTRCNPGLLRPAGGCSDDRKSIFRKVTICFRGGFDSILPKRMSQVYKLRERVRLAELGMQAQANRYCRPRPA